MIYAEIFLLSSIADRNGTSFCSYLILIYGWVDYILSHLADERPRYPVLECLTVPIGNGLTEFGSFLVKISNPLALSLEHLTIVVPGVPSPTRGKCCPQLCTLTIRRLYELEASFVRYLLVGGYDTETCPETFERLGIAGCPGLDLKKLEKVLPKEKFYSLAQAPPLEGDDDIPNTHLRTTMAMMKATMTTTSIIYMANNRVRTIDVWKDHIRRNEFA
ncbi:hypothetical protein DFH11DRAFT_1546246 [Phellopilus nigrolimitatus]|nr:hypothetical protein DFH11DRAFT_1546246 [Phellopilus nigrolimitatus]